MSGGSYCYIGLAFDLKQLFQHYSDAERMIEDLSKNDADDLAEVLNGLIRNMADFYGLIYLTEHPTAEMSEEQRQRLDAGEELLYSIQPAMKAFEWWQSRDYSEEDFRTALKKWRQETLQKCEAKE